VIFGFSKMPEKELRAKEKAVLLYKQSGKT